MRVAIFVVVVAAHVILLLLFVSLRRPVVRGSEDDVSITSIFLPPTPREPATKEEPSWQAPLQYRSAAGVGRAATRPPENQQTNQPDDQQQLEPQQGEQQQAQPQQANEPPQTPQAPDWRAQAKLTAQTSALAIVEAEDTARRRANALTSPFKPLPPPRVKGPEFGWDYAATHRIQVARGRPLIYNFNDHCQLVMFPMIFVGCRVGKMGANGDLFKNMHPPMKYGDWDWRIKDP